jgi:hypothetical protein
MVQININNFNFFKFMIYKYMYKKYQNYLIILLICLILIYFLYKSYSCVCVYNGNSNNNSNSNNDNVNDNENYHRHSRYYRENFNPNKKPNQNNLNLFANKTAMDISVATYANVVVSCLKTHTNNIDEIINCIVTSDHYYENILKQPIFELYDNLKRLEREIINHDNTISTRDKYIFVVAMTHAFSKALAITLNDIIENKNNNNNNNNNGTFALFEQNNFIKKLTHYLTEEFKFVIVKIYTDPESLLNDNKPSYPIGIKPIHPINTQPIHIAPIDTQPDQPIGIEPNPDYGRKINALKKCVSKCVTGK